MGAKPALAKLSPVDVRTVWPDEARDFTPWLAGAEGLELLANVLGLELELVEQEADVGPFSADIVLRARGEEEHTIVVENQFGKTDHDHLGKLLTYGAGLSAKTMVWIAENFSDEHREALDRLNEIAAGKANYFGLGLRVYRIQDSPPATQFEVISSPNDWRNVIRETYKPTKLEVAYQQFWSELRDYFGAKKGVLRMQQPPLQGWCVLAIGRAGFQITLGLSNRDGGRASAEVYMFHENALAAFEQLHAHKEEIDREMGEPLSWDRLRKNCRIQVSKRADFNDPKQRELLKEWFWTIAEKLNKIFSKRIKDLDL